MRSFILPLALLFIAFSAPSIAQKSEVVVVAGAPLSVECALRVEQRVSWRVDGAAPAADLQAGGERPLGAGRLLARLEAAAARPHHAGLYSCHADAEPVRVRVLPVPPALPAPPAPAAPPATPLPGETTTAEADVAASSDDDYPVTRLMFDLYHPLQLNCSMSRVTRYEWRRNGTVVKEASEGKGPVLLEGGAVLSMKRMYESDHGNYTCRINAQVARAWQLNARPLARLPADTNVVEGQAVTITCKQIGRPHTRVVWSYAPSQDDNATDIETDVEGGRFKTKESAAGVPAGELTLSDAALGDAGVYRCSPEDGTPASTTLRVKDVYAALWPFLGICLEVFILCAIILVYEKRRTKPELDDSDADAHDQ